jgi:endonuclease YncB( thermonuclease family)
MQTQIRARVATVVLLASAVVVLTVSPVAAHPAAAQASRPFAVDVVAVNGDGSLRIEVANRLTTLRLTGIEIPWCMQEGAVRRMTGLVRGQAALLELDEQREDGAAVLGYLWIDGIMLNRLLVSEGYAYVGGHPSNTKYRWELVRASESPRLANRGLWYWCPPA